MIEGKYVKYTVSKSSALVTNKGNLIAKHAESSLGIIWFM
jgi:hypothetical protein